MKHTPGPWKLGGGRSFETSSGEFYITYDKDKYGNPLFKNFCELDRNAQVIATAPEMLEVLKECITDEGAVAFKSRKYAEMRLRAINGIVGAIIAKATKERE
jgi:hypothetical protein